MKKTLDDLLYVNDLLSLYGNFLTSKQKDIMSDYYLYNLSYSEISENRGITKAAVSYSIEKSLKKLEMCEKNLQILTIFQELKKNENSEKVKIIEEIEEKIKHGI